MGNVIGSFFSGLGGLINKLLGSPLEFLSGKSCSSLCGPTWDLFCYIDNFCVSHLLKLAAVSLLIYFVFLFFYLTFQLGICQCICHTLCRVSWACFATCFSILECGCTFLCYYLPRLKRIKRRHKRKFEDINSIINDEENYDEEEIIGDPRKYSTLFSRTNVEKISGTHYWRNHRRDGVKSSLTANRHRVQMRTRGNSVHLKKHNSMAQGIRVTRATQFAQKGGSYRRSFNKRRKT